MRSARSALSSPPQGSPALEMPVGLVDGSAVRAGGGNEIEVHSSKPTGRRSSAGSSLKPARTERIEHTHAWLIAHLSNGL